jgi:hypothetical protein
MTSCYQADGPMFSIRYNYKTPNQLSRNIIIATALRASPLAKWGALRDEVLESAGESLNQRAISQRSRAMTNGR